MLTRSLEREVLFHFCYERQTRGYEVTCQSILGSHSEE